MTKQQCVQIMAMLGAFYSGGKNDPKVQAQAWYLVLEKYPYDITQKAVLNFAEHDTRDYATFPTVGKIVAEIENQMMLMEKPINEITRAIAYGNSYDNLSVQAKALITEEHYEWWLNMDAVEYSARMSELKDLLQNNRQKVLGYGQDQ